LAALGVSMFSIGAMVGKPIIGVLVDKLGTIKGVGLGLVVGIVGTFLIIIHGGNAGILFVGLIMLGVGASQGPMGPPLVCRTAFGSLDYSTIYSYMSTATALANAIMVSVYGFIYDFTGSYKYVL